MSAVIVTPDHVALQGHAGVEDAEALLAALRALERPAVDLAACDGVHAAVLQVLLALRPRCGVAPRDPWLAAVLAGLPAAQEDKPCRP